MKKETAQYRTENDLANAVARWLQSDNWEVFEEVAPFGGGGHRADIVARRGNVIWIIETKRQFNLEVLEQASNWRFYGHFVSIATWRPKRNVSIIEQICRRFDLGFITATESVFRSEDHDIREQCESPFNRRAMTDAIKQMLVEQTAAKGMAGSASHKFVTPYKLTTDKLVRVVREEPGITLDQAIKKISHHYADNRKARINLKNRIETGEIPELRIVRKKHFLQLYEVGPDGEIITFNDNDAAATAGNGQQKAVFSPPPVQIDLFGQSGGK